MFSLLYIITDWCIKEKDCEIRDYVFSDKELTIESRKLVDKIAITMLYNEIDNAIIINCILKLSKIERIVVILNILNDIALFEIAFLVDTSLNSIYVQKKNALNKLRKELDEYFHYGILKYEEVK